jgi:hypothetical protein
MGSAERFAQIWQVTRLYGLPTGAVLRRSSGCFLSLCLCDIQRGAGPASPQKRAARGWSPFADGMRN